MKSKVLPVFLFLCVFAFNGASVVSATTVLDIQSIYPGIMYGDFESWSLPVLDELFPAEDFRVGTAPGQIKDDVVLYTFPAAAVDNSDTLGDGGDDAFRTTKQIVGNYSTNTAPADPNPTGAWDTGDLGGYTWDVSVAALKSWLGGDAPIFYFNNNQVGSDLAATSLYMWGQVSLTGSGSLPDAYFYFNNPYTSPALSGDMSTTVPEANAWTPPVPAGDILSPVDGVDTDPYYGFLPGYVYVDSNQLSSTFGFLSLTPEAGWTLKKLNIGANEAAYAAYSADLTNALMLDYTAMHVDFRLGTPINDPAYIGQLNNGYEQLIIRKSSVEETPPAPVPEPATMLLLGTGLVGVAGAARRKMKKQA